MAGIISSFHEAGRKNFLIDMDATMWILFTEGIAGQSKQKHPVPAPDGGYKRAKQAKIPNHPVQQRV